MPPARARVESQGVALAWALTMAPGLALAVLLAVFGLVVSKAAGSAFFGSAIVAMLAGIALGNLADISPRCRPGLKLALRPVLRTGIVLLGFQLTLLQIQQIGVAGFAIIAVTLGATFVVTRLVGRLLGVGRRLSTLIAAGTSVCGVSAILAVNSVTEGSEEDVAYAVACVTIFGSLSMLVMPVLGPVLQMTATDYGFWTGASIHEVAQVVGAGFAQGQEAGEVATVAKLSRVLLLAPLVLALAFLRTGGSGAAAVRAPRPWFVYGFLAVVVLNSVVSLPQEVLAALKLCCLFLFTMALGAMGLEIRLAELMSYGGRPLLLGGFATLFIAALSFTLIGALT